MTLKIAPQNIDVADNNIKIFNSDLPTLRVIYNTTLSFNLPETTISAGGYITNVLREDIYLNVPTSWNTVFMAIRTNTIIYVDSPLFSADKICYTLLEDENGSNPAAYVGMTVWRYLVRNENKIEVILQYAYDAFMSAVDVTFPAKTVYVPIFLLTY